jgi:DNA-directed RNA polymerase specialized sigma subunit
MTIEEVRNYLRKIEYLDRLIDAKLSEVKQLRDLSVSITAVYDTTPVQTSKISDKTGEIVTRIIDLENELNTLIDTYIDEKTAVIKLIEEIKDNNGLMFSVLHKRYIEYKTLTEISEETCYSYQYIRELHTKALEKLVKMLNNSADCEITYKNH